MLKLNVNRVFKASVPVSIITPDGQQQDAEFSASFRVMTKQQAKAQGEQPLLDVVLVEVHDIELFDANDQVLTGDALLQAAKDDPTLSSALVHCYWDNLTKKPQRKT